MKISKDRKYAFFFLVLLFLAVLVSACNKEPVCGNGKVEEGENSATCCLDAGCVGEQTCKNNACIDPVCGENQYVDPEKHACINNPVCGNCQYVDPKQHICVNYSCCNDSACSSNENCVNHECKALTCGECEYVENHECKALACCADSDCDDNDAGTIDLCKFPATKSAVCVNEPANDCASDSDCDDNDDATKDTCSSGTPKKCLNVLIADCDDGDDFCPPDCNYKNDADCEKKKISCSNDDINCFYDALDECLLAELTWVAENNTNDIEMDITTYMNIKDETDEDMCEVYFSTKKITLVFTKDYKDELEDDGYTGDEIDDMESDAEDAAGNVEGYEWTCYFEDPDDLADILDKWKDGDYDISDFEDYDCEGDYFG